MQTASLELCRTLSELSGWTDTDKSWFLGSKYSSTEPDWNAGNTDTEDGNGYFKQFPAYDLGYLLRELPNTESRQHDSTEDLYSLMITWETEISKWKAGYKHNTDNYWQLHKAVADTPEDAACKLAIELFKQGVLKRED